MKKLWIGLCCVLVCLFMASCRSSVNIGLDGVVWDYTNFKLQSKATGETITLNKEETKELAKHFEEISFEKKEKVSPEPEWIYTIDVLHNSSELAQIRWIDENTIFYDGYLYQISSMGNGMDYISSFFLEEEIKESAYSNVSLELEKKQYSLQDKTIAYTLQNHSEKPVQVVLIPQLERKEGDTWVEVPVERGFCGTPDTIEKFLESEILLEWFPELMPGEYRVSFYFMEEKDGQQVKTQIYDTFLLKD